MLTSTSAADLFLAKLDASGDHVFSTVWLKQGGAQALAYGGGGVAVTSDGRIFVAGSFDGELALGPTPLQSVGGSDGFVAELQPAGAARWVDTIAGPSNQFGNGVALAPSGAVLVRGKFQTSADVAGQVGTSVGGYDLYYAQLAP